MLGKHKGIQTFLPHGNGLLFVKNDSLPWTGHGKTACGDMQVIETSLRHLHISAYGHAIESSVKSFYNYRTMTCFPLLHAIQSGLPLRIFFCKGSAGITKRQTGNDKSSSNGVERICCSLICLIACQHAGKAKNIPWASRKA